MKPRKVVSVVFAGGSGTRMKNATPKQFLNVNGVPVLIHTLLLFQKHNRVDGIFLVVKKEYAEIAQSFAKEYGLTKILQIVNSGETSQDSIYNGLCAAAKRFALSSVVMVHDGVRPYLTADVIDRNIDSVCKYGTAITATRCNETIVISENGATIDRATIRSQSYIAQAPQSFVLGDLLAAHDKIRAMEGGYNELVDQASVCLKLGLPIRMVEGNRGNIKITTPEDIFLFKSMLEYQAYTTMQTSMRSFEL